MLNKDRYKKLLDWLTLQTHVVISQPKMKHQQRSYQLSNSIFPVLVVKFGLFSDIRKYLVEIEVLKWSFRLQVLSFELLKQNAEHFYWKSMKEKKIKFADVLHKIKPKSLPHSQSLQKGIKSSLMNLTWVAFASFQILI